MEHAKLDHNKVVTPKKPNPFKRNLFPALALIISLAGLIFAFLMPLIGLILSLIGLIFSLFVKNGDFRMDKFGIIFSLFGLAISVVVGVIQLFILSIPVLLPVLKTITIIIGIIETAMKFFGA